VQRLDPNDATDKRLCAEIEDVMKPFIPQDRHAFPESYGLLRQHMPGKEKITAVLRDGGGYLVRSRTIHDPGTPQQTTREFVWHLENRGGHLKITSLLEVDGERSWETLVRPIE
jgi:hypothetical protein